MEKITQNDKSTVNKGPTEVWSESPQFVKIASR